MGSLDGKVALITGAAGGIGRATTRLFSEEGAKGIVMADIWDEKGEKIAKELGPKVVYIHTDVSQEVNIIKAINLAVEKFGQLDIVFSNAGNPGPSGIIEDVPTDEFDHTIAIHLRAAFLCMKHSIPIMKKQGSGCFLTTSSIAAFQQGMGTLAYSLSKAAIIQLTRIAAIELGAFGIRANAIAPGYMATGIFGQGAGMSREAAEKMGELMKEIFANSQIIPRSGLPEDIASAALFLASNSSSFITGITLLVDGGILSGRILQDPEETQEQWFKVISGLNPEDQKILMTMVMENAKKREEQLKYLRPELRERELKRMQKLAEKRKSGLKKE
ncbi:MAG: SDR family NAD(P)-dependent oxidoreductase [Candidatus Thorarchaeota archaeon]